MKVWGTEHLPNVHWFIFLCRSSTCHLPATEQLGGCWGTNQWVQGGGQRTTGGSFMHSFAKVFCAMWKSFTRGHWRATLFFMFYFYCGFWQNCGFWHWPNLKRNVIWSKLIRSGGTFCSTRPSDGCVFARGHVSKKAQGHCTAESWLFQKKTRVFLLLLLFCWSPSPQSSFSRWNSSPTTGPSAT